jgi:hypothetical protein
LPKNRDTMAAIASAELIAELELLAVTADRPIEGAG